MSKSSYNVSDEERKRILDRGEYVTVLEKDDRYSEHRPIVVLVSKKGTKYLHGIPVHKDDEGEYKANYWVGCFELSKCQIFQGQRWDMIDRYHEYLKAKHDYQEKRERQYRVSWSDLETELRARHGEIMKAWERENPEPKDPFREPCRIENGLCMIHGYSISDIVKCPQA